MILGESNAGYHADLYRCMFSKMIQYWRNIWYQRTNSSTDVNFPFGFVQLATRANDTNYKLYRVSRK
jgi:sialate O-acetylesterase